MKNLSILMLVVFASFALVSGCGKVAPTSSSLSGGSALGQSVGASASTSSNMASMAGSFSAMGSGSTPSSITSTSFKVRAQDAPPASFSTPLPADGYMSVPGMRAGETVSIRFKTLAGDVINAAFLVGKNLGSLEGFSWTNLSSGPPAAFNFLTVMASFDATPQYGGNISSMWEYICFSEIAPSLTDMAHRINIPATGVGPYPAGLNLSAMEGLSRVGTNTLDSSTEAQDYKMGGMDVHVVKTTGTPTYDFTMSSAMVMDTALGHPVPDTMTGTGVLTAEGRTNQLTMSFTIDHSTKKPKGGTMTMVSDDGHTISLTVNADGTQDGTITITATGATVATIHLEADGSGYIVDAATGTRTTITQTT
ncbi:hypothetical protein HZC35_02975 [Candidatus Saganbacteria bacterium]|nr:hypothetical protein [Candidatus Saganbacteria bacterium]